MAGGNALLRIALVSSTLLVPIAGAFAQDTRPVRPLRAGDRVWVATPDWHVRELEGWLVLLEPGFVTIRRDSALRIPVPEITRFELNIGKDPALVFGIPLGAAALGAAFVPLLTTEPAVCVANVGDPACEGELPDAVVGAFGGVVVGGLLVNALVKERWVPIPLDRIAFGPRGVFVFHVVAFSRQITSRRTVP